MDGDDGVLVVVRTGELELELELVELAGEPRQEALDLGVAGEPFIGEELAPGLELLGVGAQPLERRDPALEAPPLAQDRGALLRVVPEAGVLELVVDLRQLPL
jgi:hypothetical protein